MVRTSQCFRTEYFQLDGPPTLAAAEAFPYTLVLPASLIEPNQGVHLLWLPARRKWHFLMATFLSARLEAHQFICIALRFCGFRRQCALILRLLEGLGTLRSQATRESNFRPRAQERTLAALSVTAN